MVQTVGFVGLGNMGAPMARSLANGGFEITAFDLSDARRHEIANHPRVDATNDLAKAAACDALVLMLPNGNIVHDVLIGDGAAISTIPQGGLVIDMSSSDPIVYEELEPALARKNIKIVDAPVSGNVSGAESGLLTIMAGGESGALDVAAPLFDIMGKQTFRTGPLGSGQIMKALNNLLSAGGLILACEVLLVAKKAGLDPAQVNSILNVSTGRNNSTDRKIEPFVLSGRYDSGFGLSLMAKDLRTAASVAARLDIDMPLGKYAIDIASKAEGELDEQADHTEVACWLERKLGLSLS